MAFQSHRGTMGHKIGSSIIGKDNGKPAEPDADDRGMGQTAVGFSHMSVKPAANGFTVSHTPKGMGAPEEAPAEEQAHVFRDATEAHNHLGQRLGVRMASGLQKT